MSRKKISIELNDKNVEENLAKVVNTMSRLRMEALSNKDFSDKQRDEYFHLVYRLASSMEALVNKDDINRMDFLLKRIDKDGRLMWYDFSQEDYWKRMNQILLRRLTP